jgi:hypothetical protein
LNRTVEISHDRVPFAAMTVGDCAQNHAAHESGCPAGVKQLVPRSKTPCSHDVERFIKSGGLPKVATSLASGLVSTGAGARGAGGAGGAGRGGKRSRAAPRIGADGRCARKT